MDNHSTRPLLDAVGGFLLAMGTIAIPFLVLL
jgi:hypothetical protein